MEKAAGKKKLSKFKFGVQCPICKDKVFSKYRHDCRSCKCGYCAIDGGDDYTKISYGIPSMELFEKHRLLFDNLSKLIPEIKHIKKRRESP